MIGYMFYTNQWNVICNSVEPMYNTETFYWDGCSNKIKFGGKFTFEFLKEFASGEEKNGAMQLHNFEVGHKVGEMLLNMSLVVITN